MGANVRYRVSEKSSVSGRSPVGGGGRALKRTDAIKNTARVNYQVNYAHRYFTLMKVWAFVVVAAVYQTVVYQVREATPAHWEASSG